MEDKGGENMLNKVEKEQNTISYDENSNMISDESRGQLISKIINLKGKLVPFLGSSACGAVLSYMGDCSKNWDS